MPERLQARKARVAIVAAQPANFGEPENGGPLWTVIVGLSGPSGDAALV